MAGSVASLLDHRDASDSGLRLATDIELLWEIPIVSGMAFIRKGIASYLNVGSPAATGLITELAYLGPRGTEVLFQK